KPWKRSTASVEHPRRKLPMEFELSVGAGADFIVNYVLDNFTPALDAIAAMIGIVTDGFKGLLESVPPVLGITILTLISLWRVGWKFALFTILSLALIVQMDLWLATMQTLALVLSATIIAVALGIP